jgi:hypothetical protein
MVMILGKIQANQKGPNPGRVRDHNSPEEPGMHRQSHVTRCRPVRSAGQLAARDGFQAAMFSWL